MAHGRNLESSESTPLVSEDTPNLNVAFFLKWLDLTNSSIATLAPFFSIIAPFGAFKSRYLAGYRAGLALAIPGCLAKNALDIAAEYDNPATKAWQKRLNRIISASNVANFALTAFIALFVMGYASVHYHQDKNKEVDVSDLAYALGFLLPSFLIGAASAGLEWTKPHQNPVAKYGHHLLNCFYNASNLNSLLGLLLSPFNISETGNVNPYGRFAIFLIAFALGTGGVITSANFGSTTTTIDRIINTSCALAYLGEVFGKNSQALLGEGFTATFIVTFSIMTLTSLIQAYKSVKEPKPSPLLQQSVFVISSEPAPLTPIPRAETRITQ